MVQVTVWFGKGSTGDEREMAKALAITKNPEPELMFEGQEQGSFWSDLGGKQEYFTDLVSRQEEDDAEPRLFQLSRLNIKEKAAVIAEILCHNYPQIKTAQCLWEHHGGGGGGLQSGRSHRYCQTTNS